MTEADTTHPHTLALLAVQELIVYRLVGPGDALARFGVRTTQLQDANDIASRG